MREISSIAISPKPPLPRTPSITYCKKSISAVVFVEFVHWKLLTTALLQPCVTEESLLFVCANNLRQAC